MSLQSQLTRMAHNVGALTADTNAIFEALRAKGVNVPANAQLGDVADMIESIELPLPTVNIGGKDYPYVQIGNQLWIAKNLDYKFNVNGSQISIGGSGAPTTPAAWYYDNDESNYGIDGTYRCGLLYNWYAAKYLDDNKSTLLPEGWRVPSKSDRDILSTELGDLSAGTKLKALDDSITSNWPSNWNGTDDYGFKGLPAGIRLYNGSSFDRIGTSTLLWTITESGTNTAGFYGLSTNSTVIGYYDGDLKTYGLSLRLVKDATGYVTIGSRQYKTVTIGNQEWLAENLDYKFSYNGSTIPIGSSGAPSTPAAWYYNNDEATYGIDGTYKCGLLYNWYAAKYLDDNKATLLPDGWRLPDLDDYNILEAVVSFDNGGRILKALENFISQGFPSSQWDGTDNYGFNALPTGWRRIESGGSFTQFNEHAHFWLKNVYGENGYSWYLNNNDTTINSSIYNTKYNGFSIRLVKDVT